MLKSKSKGRSVAMLGLEVFFIVLGVILALGLNEWRQAAANAELGKSALEQVKAEIKENQERLEGTLEEHKLLRAHVEEAIATAQQAEEEGDDVALSYQFNYSSTLLTMTAWESAIVTQAVRYMDFATVQQISDIYELFEMYDKHGRDVILSMGTADFYDVTREIAQARANIYNVRLAIQLEELTLEEIQKFFDAAQ